MTRPTLSQTPQPPLSPSPQRIKTSKVIKSPFAAIALAAKKAISPSTRTNDRSLSNGLAAVFVEYSNLPTPNAVAVPAVAPNTLASTANPALILQPAALSQNIFPKNIFRTAIDVLLPEIGDRIVNTTQLVACVGLLAKSSLPVSPLSTIPTLSLSSPVQLEWLHAMEEHPLEKEHLGLLMNHMVGIFIQHPSKDSETVQEVVLLGPVLDKEHYRKLLNCFLRELQGTTVLEVGLLRGLVQLVQDAPPYCLQADDLTQILRIVRRQLEDPARQNEEYIVHLMLAITTILVIMADHKIRDLNREQEHGPLLKVLSGLRKHKDPFVKYQAEYAYQALLLVPDDESTLQEFRRHALGLTSGLLNISGVIKLDFGGIIDNLPVVIGGGRGIFDLLKEALGPGNKDPWYLAVREAEKMVQEGRLSDLNQWICDAPCSQDPKFQWGVCQLLGEITIDPSWDELTRGQAIGFLGDMFRITSVSKHQKGVKSWILTMLHQILNLTDSTIMSESVKIRVRQLICELEKANEAFLYSYPLRGRLPLPRSFALLKEVNDKPDINLVLDRLRRQRWDGFNKQAVYIEPLSKPSLQATSDIIVPLRERVAKFLESKGEVMLILGDSGAGKSTFHQRLEHKLWEEYRAGKPIPLFIDLKSIENPDKDMIHQHLEEYKIFSNLQIDELRRSQQFILICDGYDECRNWSNISANNRFNQLHQWKAKMVITCRTQYLNPNYRGYFEPQTPPPNSRSCPELFEEAVIVPFKTDQIQEYIDLYTASPETQEIFGSQPVWTSSQYMQRLKGTMNLMELIKNPFMLRMVLDTLPRIAISTTCLTRAEIYDEFVELHFENEQRRLVQQKSGGKMERDCSAAFGQLEGEDFILLGIDFSKRLSEAIFKELNGVNSVDYSVFADEGTWKDQFFGPDPRAKLLRESSQLVSRAKNQDSGLLRNKNSLVRKRNAYEFNHRSILEYFFSCLVYDPRGNPSRLNISNCLASASRPSPLVAHPLGQQNMTSEQSIIQFLAERVQNSTEFKDQLLSIVQLSRKDAAVSPAAANAMSILVRAGIIFNGADLRGIRIPGANLSGGHFDSAHMQDADLNGVNFTSAWLRQVDFTRASMKDVWFGEKPSLDAKNSSSCASSTDGKFFAQGLYTGVIHVYDTTNWTIRNTFDQHSSGVSSLAFSRDGNYLASSASNTMHIWRLQGQAGDQSCIVLEDVQGKGHITHVAISPDGHRALSVDLHGYVRIWDIDSGTLAWRNSYINNGDRVYSAAWSADGLRIALGFNNGKISLWKSANGDFDQVVAETKSLVRSIAFSFDGKYLAVSSKYVQIWALSKINGQIHVEPFIVIEQRAPATFVQFSRDGRQLVSYSLHDHSANVWDTQTGSHLSTLNADSHVSSVAVVDDHEIALCEKNQIRFWSLHKEITHVNEATRTGTSVGMPSSSRGHTSVVVSAVYSPGGEFLLSYSYDKSIRQWNTKTGESWVILQDCAPPALGSKYLISDETVRVKDYFAGGPTALARTQPVLNVVSSGDGYHRIVITDVDRQLRQYQLPPKQSAIGASSLSPVRLFEISGPKTASCVIISPDSRWLAYGGSSGVLKVRGPFSRSNYTKDKERILIGHTRDVHHLAFSPTCLSSSRHHPGHSPQQQLASSSFDGTIRFWDLESGQCTDMLTRRASTLVYSPCGGMILTCDDEKGLLKVWDLMEKKDRLVLKDDQYEINSLAWSPCGRWILSAGNNHYIRLWRIQYNNNNNNNNNNNESEMTGTCIAIIQGLGGYATSFDWSPISPMEFLTTATDHSVCVWRIVESEPGEEKEEEVCVQLVWGSMKERLVAFRAKFSDAVDLHALQRSLLQQHQVIDEPAKYHYKK